MDEAFWDERYLAAPALWSGKPNPQLLAEASALRPGRALDAGAGEGADAIWLAARGFQVTAVDISGVALERGRKQAEALGSEVAARITWVRDDLATWTPPSAAFDLVSAQFLHLPAALRIPLHRRLAAAVAPGGLLLVVAHHPSDLETSVRRPRDPGLFFTAPDVATTIGEGFTTLVEEARPRTVLDPEGRTVTIHDTVLLARRNPR